MVRDLHSYFKTILIELLALEARRFFDALSLLTVVSRH